jgi:molybdopterin-guanine dinucleotide biosynthesis protein A
MYDRCMDGIAPDSTGADVAAFILAGGKSMRMGADKAFVLLEGRTLLARALELARVVASDVRIVGEAAKFAGFAPVVEDIFYGCGPLGGIHGALRASVAELNLILAVDVPFVPPALLRFLIARARNFPEASVVVPRSEGRWQPLCAIYRREFVEAAENALQAGRYKIGALFECVRMQGIGEEELMKAGFSSALFRNLNTPQELAEAER